VVGEVGLEVHAARKPYVEGNVLQGGAAEPELFTIAHRMWNQSGFADARTCNLGDN
jgi:hypothetical protein